MELATWALWPTLPEPCTLSSLSNPSTLRALWQRGCDRGESVQGSRRVQAYLAMRSGVTYSSLISQYSELRSAMICCCSPLSWAELRHLAGMLACAQLAGRAQGTQGLPRCTRSEGRSTVDPTHPPRGNREGTEHTRITTPNTAGREEHS